MRILSLLPAATEIVYLLGLEKYLVGISHDCDFPPQVKKIPKVTSSAVSNAMSSLAIDKAVKKLEHRGVGVFHIDQERLKRINPDLILTQELCEVCAVSFNQVKKAARILEGKTKIISLEPESVEDILENIRVVGGVGEKKEKAIKVIRDLRERIENLKLKIKNSPKPKVLVVEWLNPVMVAGHWVPEMVELAGGEMLVTKVGDRSQMIDLMYSTRRVELKPDIFIIAPCGFDIKRTMKEKRLIEEIIQGIKGTQGTYLIDGNSYMTRPGPRVIDGIEILAEILHPGLFPRIYTKKDWIEFR